MANLNAEKTAYEQARAKADAATQTFGAETAKIPGKIDAETQHPVLTIERAELLRTGLTDIGDILQTLTANGRTQNRNNNNDDQCCLCQPAAACFELLSKE